MHRQHNNTVIDPTSDLVISTNFRLAFQHQRWAVILTLPVADSGGVRGVQMHPPLAASNVFLRT